MANEYKGLYIEFDGDTSKLTEALRKVTKESRSAQGQLRGIERALKFDPKSPALLSERVKSAGRACEAASRKVETLKAAQSGLGDEADGNAEAHARLSREIAVAEAYLKREQKALLEARAASTWLGQRSADMARYSEKCKAASEAVAGFGGALSSAGGAITAGLSLPLAAGGGLLVKAAVDIDTAWRGVVKTVDGTAEELEGLKVAAIDMSTVQPVSAESLLGVMELGGQLGVTKERLVDFSSVVAGLDIATNLGADDAAVKMAQLNNIMRFGEENFERFGSTVVDLGNHSATTESEILEMASRIASAGKLADFTTQEVLGIATALSSTGMNAEAGGSAISKSIGLASKAVATGSLTFEEYAETVNRSDKVAEKAWTTQVQHLETFAEVNHMTADEFKRAWDEDAAGTFLRTIANMGDAGDDLIVKLDAMGLGEIRTSDAMRRLSGNVDSLTGYVDRANEAWEENAALQAEVDKRNESLQSRFEVLRNKVTAAAEALGSPLAEALLGALDGVAPLADAVRDNADEIGGALVGVFEGAASAAAPLVSALSALLDGFLALPAPIQRGIAQFVGLSAAMGPVLAVGGRLVSWAGSLVGVWGRMVEGASGVAGALSRFWAAVTAGDQAALSAARSSGGLADKLGLLFNRVEAGGGKAAGRLATVASGLKGLAGMAAKVAIPAAVVATVAAVGDEYLRAKAKADTFRRATEDMTDAAKKYATVSEKAFGDLTTAEKVDSVRAAVDAGAEAQAALNDRLEEGSTAAEEQAGELDAAMRAIQRLGGQSDLSAADQGTLRAAVDKVNEALGTSYSLLDDNTVAYEENGEKVRANTDELYRNIQARKVAAQAEKISAKLDEENEQQEKNIKTLGEAKVAQQEANQAVAEMLSQYPQLLDMSTVWETLGESMSLPEIFDLLHRYDELCTTQREANTEVERQQSLYDEQQKKIDELAARYGLLENALGESCTAYDVFKASMANTLDAAGMGTEEVGALAQALQDAGVRVSDLSKLGADQMLDLAIAFKANGGDIRAALESLGADGQAVLQAAGDNWTDTISTSTAGLVESVAQAGHMSTAELRDRCAEWGIVGDEAVAAFAQALLDNNGDVEAARTKGQETSAAVANSIKAGTDADVSGAMAYLRDALKDPPDFQAVVDALRSKGVEIPDSLCAGIAESNSDPADQVRALGLAVLAELEGTDLTSAAQEIGVAIPDGLVEGLQGGSELAAQAATGMSEKVVEASRAALGVHSPSTVFAGIGADTVQGFVQGVVGNGDAAVGVMGALMGMVAQSFSEVPGAAGAAGAAAASAFAAGLSQGGGPEGASAALAKAATSGLSGVPPKMGESGRLGSAGFAAGLRSGSGEASSAAGSLADAASGALSPMPGKGESWGSLTASGFSGGLRGGAGAAASAGDALASGAYRMNKYAGSSYSWGLHLGNNFGAGIRAAVGAIRAAADAAVSAAQRVMGFSVPAEGPWSGAERGGERSGRHLVANFASGMRSGIPGVRAAAEAAMMAASAPASWGAAAVPAPASYRSAWAAQAPSAAAGSKTDARTYTLNVDGSLMDVDSRVRGAVEALVDAVVDTCSQGR